MESASIHSELPASEAKAFDETKPDEINEPKDVKITTKLFESMAINEQLRTDIGPSETIDVIPDFTEVVIQLVDHAIEIYQQLAQYSIPYITPATLVASMLDSIYTYGAIADIFMVRESTSYYGDQVLNLQSVVQAFTLAMHNSIPPFLAAIIRCYQFTFDPRRKNLAYIYSFAAYDFEHDFGRIYPIHMFLALHNIIAQSLPSDTETTIWTKWLQYVVIKTATEQVTVAHIIGGAYANHFVENRMTMVLHRLLSPVALLGSKRRDVLESFDFNTPDQADLLHVNPYIYLCAHERSMIPAIMNFRNLMRSITNQVFEKSVPLGKIFDIDSGAQIMNHVYTEPTLPTYHNLEVKLTKAATQSTLENFSNALTYKCTDKCKPDLKQVLLPPLTAITDNDLYLVSKNEIVDEDHDPIMSFSQDSDLKPWIIYQPYNSGKQVALYTLTSGLKIESFELDGAHVPQPSTVPSIHDENSHFLESAIPINKTYGRSHLDGQTPFRIRSRVTEKPHETKVSFSRYDMTKHYLPIYPNEVDMTDTANNYTPGFTCVNDIIIPANATTKIAYKGSDITTDEILNTTITRNFYAWSSYRYIQKSLTLDADFRRNTYYLMNFRTIYGTSPQTFLSEPLSKLVEQH